MTSGDALVVEFVNCLYIFHADHFYCCVDDSRVEKLPSVVDNKRGETVFSLRGKR